MNITAAPEVTSNNRNKKSVHLRVVAGPGYESGSVSHLESTRATESDVDDIE